MVSPVVSVICPVYNTEKVLGKCIRSVLEQDFKAIEVILVNDGSTDDSLKICQKYAARDERIILIDKPNGGRIQARKDGLLRAQGEYVFFIDCDDYLEKNALSTLVEIAGRHHLDMVAGNHDTVYDNWGLVSMQRQDLLPDVLLHYIRYYGWELVGRLHYQAGSLDGILQFIDEEYHGRIILSWARLHQSKIGQRWRDHVLMSAVVNHKVDEIIHYARQREAFLQKHYRKMKMVGLYQKIMDYCSFLVG